jgi:hypothetical protein
MSNRDDDDAELIAKSAAVAQVFTPELHAYVLSLLPVPDLFRTNQNNYAASFTGYLTGNTEQQKECAVHRETVGKDMDVLQGVVKAVAIKDPKVLEAFGLAAQPVRAAHSSVVPSEATGFKVTFNSSGQMVGAVTKVKGAKWYQVWACDGDPTAEENWRLVVSSSTCRGITIAGLDRTKTNCLRIRAMGSKEPGPWSHMITIKPS